MNPPVISVIVPVYNSESTLGKCVDSICNQSFRDIEILIVDDGSTDSSYEVCKKYESRDYRVKVLRQTNLGPFGARKTGVMLAKGEWLVFVDSDDTLPASALEELYRIADDNIDIVVSLNGGGGRMTSRKLRKIYGGKFPGTLSAADYCCSLLDFSLWPLWGKLYRKTLWDEVVMSLPLYFRVAEDFLVNLRLLSNLRGYVGITDSEVYNYTCNSPTSILATFRPDSNYEFSVMAEVEASLRRFMLSTHYDERINDFFLVWKLRYIVGMIGIGCSVGLSEQYLRHFLSECGKHLLPVYGKILFILLNHRSLWPVLRLERKTKDWLRNIVTKVNR